MDFHPVINLFCMVAVIVVTSMAYETIREGVHLILHPVASHSIWLNIAILLLAMLVDGYVLVKAMKEIIHETKVVQIIFSEPSVTDINKMRIVQEGRFYHVEAYIELRAGLSLADTDDINFLVRDHLLPDPDINDVTLGIIEDNGVRDWSQSTEYSERT